VVVVLGAVVVVGLGLVVVVVSCVVLGEGCVVVVELAGGRTTGGVVAGGAVANDVDELEDVVLGFGGGAAVVGTLAGDRAVPLEPATGLAWLLRAWVDCWPWWLVTRGMVSPVLVQWPNCS
jgi:hypothetical protein